MEKRVVVIGGSGFLGSNMCSYLADRGYSIISCDQKAMQIWRDGITFFRLTKWSELEDIIQKDDNIVDLAFKGVPNTLNENWYDSASENILGALTLINICIKKKAGKIIFASSGGAIYGPPEYVPIDEKHPTMPVSSYGVQKLVIEHYLRLAQKQYGLQTICLRISNLYGPGQVPFTGQGVLATFVASGILNKPIEIWGTGEEQRDYIFVKDVVRCFEKALYYNGNEMVFNVGSGNGISLNALILTIEEVLGKRISKTYLPQSSSEVGVNFLECIKAEKILYWQPQIDLRQGIKEMLSVWEPEKQVFLTDRDTDRQELLFQE